MSEAARDRHQALKERWAKGVLLGHARHASDALVATVDGITKAWAAKRLLDGQHWDGERTKKRKGSPTN